MKNMCTCSLKVSCNFSNFLFSFYLKSKSNHVDFVINDFFMKWIIKSLLVFMLKHLTDRGISVVGVYINLNIRGVIKKFID